MKVILKIARQELETLFFSPIAWLILIIFSLQCGISFTDKLAIFESNQYGGTQLSDLTIYMFSSSSSFFAQLQKYLYLYIPLVTMGLMSRETSSGTIKLLFSSPVKLTSIILGKYLSMMVYGLLLVIIMMMICIGGIYSIQNIDYGILFSSLLGLYLLICAYAAIGLYMSCLTSYQMIAALSTLVVLGVLSYIGGVWQNVAFVRDLTYFLSINGRAGRLFFGLISSKDLVYFILVIGLFLLLAIIKLQDDRRARGMFSAVSRYVGLIATVLILGYISSRPAFTIYSDVTAQKTNTLTKTSQDLIEQFDKPLKITAYVNILEPTAYLGLPSNQISDMENFEKFIRFKPDMEMEYVYYYDQPLEDPRSTADAAELLKQAKRKAEAERMNFSKILSPVEIRKIIDLRSEKNRFVRQLNYEGKTTFLRMFNDPQAYPGEQEISVALKQLLVKAPKIGFVTGHDEPNIDGMAEKDYQDIVSYLGSRSSLINLGYDVSSLSLAKDIPADVDVLVLADPWKMLSKEELARISAFIDHGGSMLLAGEPGRQSFINPVIAPLGVQLKKGIIIQNTKDIGLTYALAQFSAEAGAIPAFRETVSYRIPVALPNAAALSYNAPDSSAFKVAPMLVTDPDKNWNRISPLLGDSLRLSYNPNRGDQKGVIPLAYALNREVNGKNQNILVIGDASFFSNGELSKQNINKANYVFTHNIFSWLTGGSFPVDVSRPRTIDNLLTVSRGDISIFQIIYLGIIPGLIGIFGAILLIRRKRN